MNSYLVCNVLLHVILMASFLGLFFFTYASYIEKNIVKNQTENIVNSLTNDLTILMPQEAIALIGKNINITPPNMQAQDEQVAKNNMKLLKQAMIVIIAFVIIGTSIVAYLCHKNNLSLLSLFKHNFIALIFIAITEFCFLTFIAQNYITVDQNFVKSQIIQTLINS